MKHQLEIILLSMVVLDIMDRDFRSFSILGIIKSVLYLLCFVLLILKKKESMD